MTNVEALIMAGSKCASAAANDLAKFPIQWC